MDWDTVFPDDSSIDVHGPVLLVLANVHSVHSDMHTVGKFQNQWGKSCKFINLKTYFSPNI